MARRTVVSTPFPSVDATAKEMGVGRKRVRELARLVIAIVRGREGRILGSAVPPARRRGKGAVAPARSTVSPPRRTRARRRASPR